MATVSASFYRDQNYVPITTDGVVSATSKTLVANNTTAHVPIFGITGSVEIRGLWAVVTTVLGNNTAAYFRVNDGTNTPAITVSSGTTLTSAPVGSLIVKKGLAAAAVTLLSAAASTVSEPTTLETPFFSPFVVTQLTAGVATNIEFTYTTSDTPTSGVIQFFLRWLPLSQGANITPQ
jgi:hypothetical protein